MYLNGDFLDHGHSQCIRYFSLWAKIRDNCIHVTKHLNGMHPHLALWYFWEEYRLN